MKSPGIELIHEERARQVGEEGYDAEHDDSHTGGELALAAKTYCDISQCQHSGLTVAVIRDLMRIGHFASWPWPTEPPKLGSRLESLIKAGALIAAEIDRIKRAEERSVKETAESGKPY